MFPVLFLLYSPGRPHVLPTLTTSMPSPTQLDVLSSNPGDTEQHIGWDGEGGERQLKQGWCAVPWPRRQCWEQKEKQTSHLVHFMDRSFISSQRTAANTCSVGKPAIICILFSDWPQMLFSLTNRETEVKGREFLIVTKCEI